MRRLRALPLTLSMLALALGLTPALVAAGPASAAAGDHQDHRSAHALEALQLAQGLLSKKTPEDALDTLLGQATGQAGGLGGAGDADGDPQLAAPDASMALRNLFLAKNSLSRTQQERAERILARPTTSKKTCSQSPPICVHYSSSGAQRARWTFVKQTMSVMRNVYSKYTQSGFRRPVRDGDKYVDVYLRDIASQGLYGYCTSETSARKAPAYCVLDNDYAKSQYPMHTPSENLKVTAAHEFFHAVQFAYDAAEDLWLMEATATWAEERLYDGINDNRQYLPYGQLRRPGTPLDTSASPNVYGNWIFFGFLTAQFPGRQGVMPKIVHDIWRRAESTYSIKAVNDAVRARNGNFSRVYAKFNAINQHPKNSMYTEGGAYRGAPKQKVSFWKSSGRKTGGWSVDHLTSKAVRFIPKNTPNWRRLHLTVNAPKGSQAYAWVTLYLKNGKIKHTTIPAARGTRSFPFATSQVAGVELVASNAGRRYNCGDGSYSCNGKSLENNRKITWSARLSSKANP